MDGSMPGSSVLHYRPEFAQIHVRWVSDTNHLILWCPLILPSFLPSIRVFFNELTVRIRWPECWSFSFSISPSSEYLGLISFRIGLKALPIDKGVVFCWPYSRVNFNQHELIKKCQVVVWNVSLRFPWPQGLHLLFLESCDLTHEGQRALWYLCTSVVCICTQDGEKSYHDQLSFPSQFDRVFGHELLLLIYLRWVPMENKDFRKWVLASWSVIMICYHDDKE